MLKAEVATQDLLRSESIDLSDYIGRNEEEETKQNDPVPDCSTSRRNSESIDLSDYVRGNEERGAKQEGWFRTAVQVEEIEQREKERIPPTPPPQKTPKHLKTQSGQ